MRLKSGCACRSEASERSWRADHGSGSRPCNQVAPSNRRQGRAPGRARGRPRPGPKDHHASARCRGLCQTGHREVTGHGSAASRSQWPASRHVLVVPERRRAHGRNPRPVLQGYRHQGERPLVSRSQRPRRACRSGRPYQAKRDDQNLHHQGHVARQVAGGRETVRARLQRRAGRDHLQEQPLL